LKFLSQRLSVFENGFNSVELDAYFCSAVVPVLHCDASVSRILCAVLLTYELYLPNGNTLGYVVAQLVEALRCKPEGRAFFH
jgi:hypothetical protein